MHDSLKHFAETETPVQLKNVVVKETGNSIFNQQSAVHQADSADVPFAYTEQAKPETSGASISSITVKISEVKNLQQNQRVNISGSLSMGNDKPKEVLLKSSGQAGNVKEDCVLEDETGTSVLHIWEPLLPTLKNGDSYLFTNLTVRNFQGPTFLSTSPLTTTSPSTTTLKTLSGPEMLKSPEKEVTAKCIDLVAKLNIFCSCTVCKKKLNDAESFSCATLKCENCGTRQRAKSVKHQATVRLCITDSATKEEIWIQAFSDHIEALLAGSDLSLRSKTDDIEVYLMSIEDLQFMYNLQTKVITKVVSFKVSNIKEI